VGLGVVLRLIEYAHGRSYWLDEYSLLGNIEGKSPFDLLAPMGGTQLAPAGFLALERLIAAVLGASPYALRLLPLAAGIGAMFAFRGLAMRVLTGPAVPIAVGAFALSDDLIYYGAELKPYSFDAASAVLAYWFGVGAITGRRSPFERPAALAFGLFAPWLAFASGFLLPVLALAWVGSAAGRKDRRDLCWAIGSGLLWGISGLGSLLVARSLLSTGDFAMQRFWDFAFLPIPPTSRGDWESLLRHLLNAFAGPGRLALPIGPAASASVGLGLALVGSGLLARDRDRGWPMLALLLLPGLLQALASGARLYPFHGRLMLHLAPPMLLLIARSLGGIWGVLPPRRLRVALVAFVFVVPTIEALRLLEAPHRRVMDPHGDLRPDPF
jgi:hypothetical protein